MKSMSCKQLGGACDKKFQGETFDEIAEKSRKHGIEMLKNGDLDHLDALKNMRERMSDPVAMHHWMKEKRTEFASLPEE